MYIYMYIYMYINIRIFLIYRILPLLYMRCFVFLFSQDGEKESSFKSAASVNPVEQWLLHRWMMIGRYINLEIVTIYVYMYKYIYI